MLQDSAKDGLYDRSAAYQCEEYHLHKVFIVLMCSAVSVSHYRDMLIDFYDDIVKRVNTRSYPNKKLLAIMTALDIEKLPHILEAIRQAEAEIITIEVEANREF